MFGLNGVLGLGLELRLGVEVGFRLEQSLDVGLQFELSQVFLHLLFTIHALEPGLFINISYIYSLYFIPSIYFFLHLFLTFFLTIHAIASVFALIKNHNPHSNPNLNSSPCSSPVSFGLALPL